MNYAAFTRPRQQQSRKCLANAETEPEQKSAGHSFTGSFGLCWEGDLGYTTAFSPSITHLQTEFNMFTGQMDAQPNTDYIR